MHKPAKPNIFTVGPFTENVCWISIFWRTESFKGKLWSGYCCRVKSECLWKCRAELCSHRSRQCQVINYCPSLPNSPSILYLAIWGLTMQITFSFVSGFSLASATQGTRGRLAGWRRDKCLAPSYLLLVPVVTAWAQLLAPVAAGNSVLPLLLTPPEAASLQPLRGSSTANAAPSLLQGQRPRSLELFFPPKRLGSNNANLFPVFLQS